MGAAAASPLRRSLLLCGGATLVGCAGTPHLESDEERAQATEAVPSDPATAGSTAADDWHAVRLPGKALTHYQWEHKGGRRALAARAERSASMWRRRLSQPPERVGEVAFSWWVDRLIEGASVAHAEREDAPARVLFGFGGDRSRLSTRNRALFELAHALTGEAPPFATLMYAWAANAPLERVIVNARTDRVRTIVVDSGPTHLGRWRDHQRHLAQDYRRAFGEDPGPLLSVALMTDSDNTRSSASAWYGPVRLL